MKISTVTMFVSALAIAGLAQAQSSEVRESTDPARVAEVEQRAADLQARQQAARENMTSGDSGTGATSGKHHQARKSSSGQSGQSGHSGHASGHGAGHGASGGHGPGSSNK